jgi:hypothetical protein
VTLEEFGLAVDPVDERLISVPGLAKAARPGHTASCQILANSVVI